MRIRRHRWVIGIVSAMLVILALSLPACGSGGSATTAANAAEVKTYTDPDYGYSFAYPASWQIQQDTSVDVSAGGTVAGSVGVFDPEGAKAGDTYIDLMLVSVYKLTITVGDSNLAQIKSEIESVLQSLEGQGGDMKRERPLTETSAAGMTGYEVTYSFTKEGVPCTSTLYFLFNGNMEYQLTTQASTENWEADQPIFKAMISSFKPGPTQ